MTEKDLKANTTYYIYDSDKNQKTDTEAVNGKDYYFFGESYDWQPTSRSSLNHAGVLVVDIDRNGITPAFEVDYDIIGKQYNPRPTIGCYTTLGTTIVPQEGGSDGNKVYNFYVDPNENGGEEFTKIGDSWNEPIRFLADVLSYIKDQNYGDKVKCNVYVKQGTVNNTNSYVKGTRIRVTGFSIPDNTYIYGGYPADLEDTKLERRNPNTYVTTITGNVQGEYDVNVAHLIRFRGTKNATLDGFSVRYANARSTELLKTDISQLGAAFVVGADSLGNLPSNVTIRNCGVAGNTANAGAVARINGGSIKFENCIFHNNESRELSSDGSTAKANNGNIVVEKDATAEFNHCDFLRNVGFAIDNYGKVTVKNSVFYGNMQEPLSDTRNNGSKALKAVRLYGNGTYVSDHNLYDAQSADFLKALSGSSSSTNDQTILDYIFTETSTTYPRFNNPTKNAGVTTSGDATYYGRTISFMPHNNNPMVNAASTDEDNETKGWSKDMTTILSLIHI